MVQKCWFDGPHVEPAVDYKALFTNKTQAEKTAYQSAHAHAAQHHSVVRTLLMQSGYAFSAAGKLFWVRCVYATPSRSDSLTSIPEIPCHGGAQVILTNGVIGGTGNANSRRGSEVAHNRIFLGPDGRANALQVIVKEKLPETSVLSWVPFGPLSDFMQGWSAQSHQTNGTAEVMDATPDVSSAKRSMMDGQPQQQFHYHTTSARPPKRHCGQVPNSFAAEPVDMCNYMST